MNYPVTKIQCPPITNWVPFCEYVGFLFERSHMDTQTIADTIGEPESYVYAALSYWREHRGQA